MEHIKEDMEKLKEQINDFNLKYNVKLDIYYDNNGTITVTTRLRV